MSRFFVPKESVRGDSIYISGKEAHHIIDVMRLKVLDEVTVFDGTGKEYLGVVKTVSRKSLEVAIKNTYEPSVKSSLSMTLIQAIPKKDKMDYIVEKATELGVSRILPVTTKRTIPEWNDSKKTNIVERWRKISTEAAKQCGRSDIPEIKNILSIDEAVRSVSPIANKLIAVLSDKAIKLKTALNNNESTDVIIAIGPEGDFTKEEALIAVEAGFKVVDLGALVLKSDTAALAALAIINYEYRD